MGILNRGSQLHRDRTKYHRPSSQRELAQIHRENYRLLPHHNYLVGVSIRLQHDHSVDLISVHYNRKLLDGIVKDVITKRTTKPVHTSWSVPATDHWWTTGYTQNHRAVQAWWSTATWQRGKTYSNRRKYVPPMMGIVALVLQLLVLGVTLYVIVMFSLSLRKPRIMHNQCHTDNMKIDDLHGHTEPHV